MPVSSGAKRATIFAFSLGAALASAILNARAADPAPRRAPAPVAPAPVPSTTFFDFTFGVRLASDYNFRGISQSDREFSPQAYAELQFWDNLFYAGIAGYRVKLPTDPAAEIDLTAGIRPKFGPLTFDFGVIHYHYPNEEQLIDLAGTALTPRDTDFTEFAGKVSWNIQDALILGGGVFYTDDWLGTGATGTYYNVTAKYNLPGTILPSGFAISGEFGRYELGTATVPGPAFKLVDYNYWNAGVSYTWENVTLDLRYHDTDLNKNECYTNTTDPRGALSGSLRSKWCSEAFIATLSFDFVGSKTGIFGPAK